MMAEQVERRNAVDAFAPSAQLSALNFQHCSP